MNTLNLTLTTNTNNLFPTVSCNKTNLFTNQKEDLFLKKLQQYFSLNNNKGFYFSNLMNDFNNIFDSCSTVDDIHNKNKFFEKIKKICDHFEQLTAKNQKYYTIKIKDLTQFKNHIYSCLDHKIYNIYSTYSLSIINVQFEQYRKFRNYGSFNSNQRNNWLQILLQYLSMLVEHIKNIFNNNKANNSQNKINVFIVLENLFNKLYNHVNIQSKINDLFNKLSNKGDNTLTDDNKKRDNTLTDDNKKRDNTLTDDNKKRDNTLTDDNKKRDNKKYTQTILFTTDDIKKIIQQDNITQLLNYIDKLSEKLNFELFVEHIKIILSVIEENSFNKKEVLHKISNKIFEFFNIYYVGGYGRVTKSHIEEEYRIVKKIINNVDKAIFKTSSLYKIYTMTLVNEDQSKQKLFNYHQLRWYLNMMLSSVDSINLDLFDYINANSDYYDDNLLILIFEEYTLTASQESVNNFLTNLPNFLHNAIFFKIYYNIQSTIEEIISTNNINVNDKNNLLYNLNNFHVIKNTIKNIINDVRDNFEKNPIEINKKNENNDIQQNLKNCIKNTFESNTMINIDKFTDFIKNIVNKQEIKNCIYNTIMHNSLLYLSCKLLNDVSYKKNNDRIINELCYNNLSDQIIQEIICPTFLIENNIFENLITKNLYKNLEQSKKNDFYLYDYFCELVYKNFIHLFYVIKVNDKLKKLCANFIIFCQQVNDNNNLNEKLQLFLSYYKNFKIDDEFNYDKLSKLIVNINENGNS